MSNLISVAIYTKNSKSPDLVREAYDLKLYNPNEINKLLDYVASGQNIFTNSSDKDIVRYTRLIYPDVKMIYISESPVFIDVENNKYQNLYLCVDTPYEDIREQLDNTLQEYYTTKKIKQIGIQKILEKSLSNLDPYDKVHLIIDLSIIDPLIAPSVQRDNMNDNNNNMKDYLTYSDIQTIINCLKNRVRFLDIVGFDERFDDEACRLSRITGETVKIILRDIFDLKEKSINIFNDESRFLIYRNAEQENDEDIGWKIVRFMTLKEREQILSQITDDDIKLIEIDDNEYYFAATTINEQNMKSYFTAQNLLDCCLFPQEKMFMVFELLNTRQDKQNKQDKQLNYES